MDDYDRCIETEIIKINKKENGVFFLRDLTKFFLMANNLGKVFQQATDHAMQSNMNKE